MKFINVPFLIITASLLVGIVAGYYIEIDRVTVFSTLSICVLGLGIFWFRSKKMFSSTISFSILSIAVFSTIGIALVHIHNPTKTEEHYLHLITNEADINSQSCSAKFFVIERLKPSAYYNKFIISVNILQGKRTEGKMLLLVPRDDTVSPFSIGEEWIGLGKLQPIQKPLNPDQFDYATYLSKQYVYYQFTSYPDQLKKTGVLEKSIYRLADQVRSDIIEKLSNHQFSAKQLSIIKALLLGQRQDIDRNTFKDYRDAGALHILAVSGLHVGVLMFIFNFLLKPLDRFRKKGKIIKTILVIFFLWSFAVIAGLSPSVLRAVTMFSFLLIGLQYRSKINIYNSMLASLFVLLCFQPLLLFSVGFQLSYLAVFAIIWIQPMLASFYIPKFKLDKILWETFTVTIAAQLGLLPITLFYFHQFPLLFFVANLLIIPMLGIILGIGVLAIILAEIGFLPDFLVHLFGSLINGMNTIVHWVAAQPRYVITDITFSWRMLVFSYVLIVLSVITIQKYSIQKIVLAGLGLAALLIVIIGEKELHQTKEELIVFHNPRNTALGLIQNRTMRLFVTDTMPKKMRTYLLGNYLINNNAQLVSVESLQNVYRFVDKTIFILDTSGVYELDSFQPDILLLSKNPKVHLGRVIEQLHPKRIIADGSNWKSYTDQWEKTCERLAIPFYRTDTSGAFILKK